MVQFSIASFNARWGYDTANRPFDVLAACRGLDADVIALQEVWEPDDEPGAAREAAGSLGYQFFEAPLSGSNVRIQPRITRRPHEIDGWWGLALLSRFPLIEPRSVDLGRRGGRVDIAHRRAILAGIDVGGTAVTVAAVHLSFVAPSTLAQLRQLRRMLRVMPGPAVVVGDFNLPRAVVGPALVPWRSAVRGATFPDHRPRLQLDHVLVNGGLAARGQVLAAGLGSDHRPVRATVSVGAGSGRARR